jgi:CxxC-x17-CxxC domain-containing protein
MYMTDQNIVCADCSGSFVFSASEQEFFASKGYSAPRRCKSCRDAAKAAKGQGGGGVDGPRSGGGGSDRPREMHPVTCASCGTQTQVPFKPTGDRPVYCRDCFQR